jgi:hypothetical protein
MPACIIQQLFRQIVGQDVDPCLVDDVLFPMLRSRKLSRELSQDIKLVNNIMGEDIYFETANIVPVFRPEWTQYHDDIASSKRVSNVRRSRIHRSEWGAIDILNELRELNYPPMGRPSKQPSRNIGSLGSWFADFYIDFKEEDSDCSGRSKDHRTELVYNFLEDILNNDRFLDWGRPGVDGRPGRGRPGRGGYALRLRPDLSYYYEE